MNLHRIEHDKLGSMPVAAESLHGIHTARALENFPIAARPVHPALARAYGAVKLACAQTNRGLGVWSKDEAKASAIIQACQEMQEGSLPLVVDALQGGAGTSTNMNANEVLANRALVIMGLPPGTYDRVSPLDDINRHQSTNDTFPTALKLAAILMCRKLEQQVVALQESFQKAEQRFAHVLKVGRTQMQDAVLTTLGRSMGAYAEALNRDRWRIYKCEERLRVVNLGGTAIGTGLTAPRQYIFRVTDTLRELTGIGFARAENLVEATQNTDVFVEVSGILKAHASTLIKIGSDLRFMASGPDAGLGEILLPPRQAGSSIMPGKVNPVIPEAVTQAAMMTIGHDASLTMACASGNLELNPFLPLVATCLLDSLFLLTNANEILRRYCIDGLTANEKRCQQLVDQSTAVATALLPRLGYEKTEALVNEAMQSGKTFRQTVLEHQLISSVELDLLLSPESICRLGTPDSPPT